MIPAPTRRGNEFQQQENTMKYRIMKIGDKYAAQLVHSDGRPGEYIAARGLSTTWYSPERVMEYCLLEKVEAAKALGENYIIPHNLLASAEEVMA